MSRSHSLSRRTWLKQSTLLAATAAVATQGANPALAHWLSSEGSLAGKRLLFFTKSSGFQHSVIAREGNSPSYADRIMLALAKEYGFEVENSKDGTVFDGDLDKYDAIFFMTTGDLTQVGTDGHPAMSPKGKERLLEAISKGKGFMGCHCASDTFHSAGPANENQEKPDPYIAMLGGEFIRHGRQQEARMLISSPKFPGLEKVSQEFKLNEEWYSLKNFAPDMHVILVTETEGMVDADYDRPKYPGTWARQHGDGRVFYTSMGHREDVWSNDIFKNLILGAFRWTTKVVDADLTPNLKEVTPGATTMPKL
jgi:type 1 glutamine amidotransferase